MALVHRCPIGGPASAPGPVVTRITADCWYEAGTRRDRGWRPGRVALIAQWSRGTVVSRSVDELTRQLASVGFDVLVISACEAPGPLQWPLGLPDRTTVLRRRNVGHDFGSWASALATFPQLLRARRVVLANDSMIGPFRSLRRELQLMERHPVDVWGLTAGTQVLPHLQTYFLYFREGILADRPLRDYWASIVPHASKWETVEANELGLARLLKAERYTWQSVYPAPPPGEPNRTIGGWEALLAAGFPFVKRMLVAHDTFEHERFRVTRTDIADAVRQRYPVDLEEWI